MTAAANPRHRPVNVLLVEDNEIDTIKVRRAFQQNHIENQLFVAANGLEALSKLRDNAIPAERRMVLLDLSLPRMNGIEFIRALRKDRRLATTPVVVLTGSTQDRDRIEAYRLNVAGYLLKPIAFESLCELVSALDKYWALVEMP